MPFGLGLGGTGFGLAPTKTIRTYGRRGGQHRTVAAMPMRETLSAFQELSVDSPESSVEVPDQKVSEDTPKLSVDLSLDEENAASLSNADFGVVNGKTVAVGKKAAKTTPKMKAAPRKPATKKTTQKVTVNSAPKTDKEVGDNLDVVTEPLPVSRSRRTAPKIIIHEDVDDSRSSSSAPSISAIPSDKSTSSAVDASTSPLFDDSKLTQKSPETPSWKSTFDISPVAASTPVGFALSALTSTHSRRISFPKSPDSSLSAVHVADFKSNEVTDKLQMPEQRTPQCTGETSILERSFRRLSLSGRKVAVDRRRTIAPESLQTPRAKTVDDVLTFCGQNTAIPFDDFITNHTHGQIRKLGEATFSEVFSAHINVPFSFTDSVGAQAKHSTAAAMKVLPFGDDRSVLVNGETQTAPEDLLQELQIARALSEGHGRASFIQFHGAVVVRGQYAPALLKEWDDYDDKKDSENDRPDHFSDDQLYCIILLELGGSDLEHSTLRDHDQALSLLGQVAYSLADAEWRLAFEHRDLHWGNILLNDTTEEAVDFGVMEGAPNRRVVPTFGKRCCIIDFTFSRLAIGGDDKLVAVAADNAASIFYRPYDDEAFFEGEGDYQFDIYRDMRDVMREGVETTQTASDAIDWSGFRPKTNVLWLHYLVDKLLDGVAYKKKPKGTRGRVSTSSSKKLLVDLRKRLLSYDSARHFVAEDPVFVALAEMVPLPKGDERE